MVNQAGIFWQEGDELHVDLALYARLRHLTMDQAESELHQLMDELAPGIEFKEAK